MYSKKINTYRIYHPENALVNTDHERITMQNAGQYQQKQVQLRSVLWPKICFTMLKEYHGYQYSREPHHNHMFQQVTRKCFPLEIQ
ncbi:unnamed protein product [Rotaria sp. Silwood1]|nr:unnamed protein product [Rotaria sp. Silwood1]CAF1270879.1 unnamed protein product [Rotaria sp. Silwood1]CAF3475466.1 unnamed protein product [Rotaria sp. Silwood1]CAF3526193.1 unnamed protein product [Rotaria sp. Silwood1]CAF4550464.1 unnamed protein product [Rotaria sp. Silwood1]